MKPPVSSDDSDDVSPEDFVSVVKDPESASGSVKGRVVHILTIS